MPRGQLGIQSTVNGRFRMQGDAVTMARLTETLGVALGRPVVDKTRLTGAYDVALDFSPEGMGPGPKAPALEAGGANPAECPRDANDSGPTLFTAFSRSSTSSSNRARGRWICWSSIACKRCLPKIKAGRILPERDWMAS